MAEIRVQEKRGGLGWLWMLLLLLLVALAVWYFMGTRDADGTVEPAPATTPAAAPAADPGPAPPGHPPATSTVYVRA
jgi:hypothetical protein